LEHALRRAKEIKNEAKQVKTRVYACFLKHQREQIDYFLQRGFTHDEGMYLLDRHESVELPYIEAPESVAVQAWKMETDPERRQFITAHRSVFPRHPYTTGRLLELMSLPGWNNFTAWHGAEIAGNVMLFWKNDTTGCIEDLFVQKRWRRRGIARYLLYAALDHFRRAGIHRVQLEMWSANKPALNLYRAFGFSPIDETEIAVGRYV
jgi:GNAT superfamily N-acetyltransferase